eukprot:1487797-Pleurochrysis_carterae.AAC.5
MATDGCFSVAQKFAARLYMKTQPNVEWRVAQSESDNPDVLGRRCDRSKGDRSVMRKVHKDVLAELEAREQKSAFESNRRGRVFLAQKKFTLRKQSNKPHKKGNPKRAERPNTFDKEWSARFGNCRHCGGKQWPRDCTER